MISCPGLSFLVRATNMPTLRTPGPELVPRYAPEPLFATWLCWTTRHTSVGVEER